MVGRAAGQRPTGCDLKRRGMALPMLCNLRMTALATHPETTSEAMERLNRAAWRDEEALRWYSSADGFLDPGERLAFHDVLSDIEGQPVLDLGVGGGRTTGHLLSLTSDYLGIDYTPELVTACRRRFPGVHFELADARDLSALPSNSFQLVVFSYNGIDAVDLEGRERVLAEAFRVLKPGGAFFFSTFNRNGPDFTGAFRLNRKVEWTWNPVRLARQAARFAIFNTVGFLRRLANVEFEANADDHGILLHSAHDFGVLVFATTAGHLKRQLAQAGFADDSRVIGSRTGFETHGEFDPEDVYVHVIARKPAQH